MIEILPGNLSRGIQLVGLRRERDRWVARSILIAFRKDWVGGGMLFRPAWLIAGLGVPSEAIEDLALEWPLDKGLPRKALTITGGCPICGALASEGFVTNDSRSICSRHLTEVWEDKILAGSAFPGEGTCHVCGGGSPVLWQPRGPFPTCTRCLLEGRQLPECERWMVLGGEGIPMGAKGELGILLRAWKLVGGCHRCGSKSIRMRRLSLDLPRATGPVYPLWELRREDVEPHRSRLRERQLRIFTQGLLKVTFECPQCGYLEREFQGTDVSQNQRTDGLIPFS